MKKSSLSFLNQFYIIIYTDSCSVQQMKDKQWSKQQEIFSLHTFELKHILYFTYFPTTD